MMSLHRVFPFLAAAALVALVFQNCGIHVVDDSGAGSDGTTTLKTACEQSLYAEFRREYHPFLRTLNCQSCHSAGGFKGDAPFADANPEVAFAAFKPRGPNTFNTRVMDGHNVANGPSYKTRMDAALAAWLAVERSCGQTDLSLQLPAGSLAIFDPTRVGDPVACGEIGDPVTPSGTLGGTLTWNAGTVRSDLQGVTIKLRVRPNRSLVFDGGATICSAEGYRAGDLMITTDKPLRVQNVRVLVNGNHHNVNSYLVERSIPAGSVDYLFSQTVSGGWAVYSSGPCRQADQWSINIDSVEVLGVSR